MTGLQFDDGLLSIALHFAEGPGMILQFHVVRGFRLLDEGDLLEFWDPDVRVVGWLWLVEAGGWRDQELRREGFLSGINPTYREYLVGGANDCVSVFSDSIPTFTYL